MEKKITENKKIVIEQPDVVTARSEYQTMFINV